MDEIQKEKWQTMKNEMNKRKINNKQLQTHAPHKKIELKEATQYA